MSNRNKKLLKPIEIYLAIILDLDINCLTIEIIEKRLSSLTNNIKIQNKSTNGKIS